MKIYRHLRKPAEWPFTASKPGGETMRAPSLGMALSLAQNWACRHDGPATFYVTEYEDTICHVVRDEKGTVYTRAA